jgi:hypothetical protein
MPLDIVLSKNGKAPAFDEQTSICFDNKADYWYLWPTMIQEIKNQTGELLDLYDDAKFLGDDLPKLEIILINQIKALQERKEKAWTVLIDNGFGPFETLVKKDLENKLEKFIYMVRLAKERNEKIICLGD